MAGVLSGVSLTDPAELEATDLACDMIASFYSLDRCEAHGTPAEVLTVAKINRVHLVQVILARAQMPLLTAVKAHFRLADAALYPFYLGMGCYHLARAVRLCAVSKQLV